MLAGFKLLDFAAAILLSALIFFLASVLNQDTGGYATAFQIAPLTIEGENVSISVNFFYGVLAVVVIIFAALLVFLSKELHSYTDLIEVMERLHHTEEQKHEKLHKLAGKKSSGAESEDADRHKKRRIKEIKRLAAEIRRL
ncbi:MAG TPA: hypothetical protein VI933_02620 [archaeon]|nr:hypothetical protein [archaeon]